jgi:hypothetical protein
MSIICVASHPDGTSSCTKTQGHPFAHRDARGREWPGEGRRKLHPCPFTLGHASRACPCDLPEGHAGDHQWRGIRFREAAPPPSNKVIATQGGRVRTSADMELDRVARLLIDEWERVEGVQINPSYVATFVDMARVILADREANTWQEPPRVG